MIRTVVPDQRAACAHDQRAPSPSFWSNGFCDRAFRFSRPCETRPPKLPPCRGSGISRLREYHASPSVCEPVHISRRNDRVPDVLSPGKVGGTTSEMRLEIQKVGEEAPAHDLSPNAVPAPRYPSRFRLLTKPNCTGSAPVKKTIGIVAVTALAASGPCLAQRS